MAVTWTNGATPTPAADLKVTAFAQGLDHPRWLYVLPNSDVLVAETNGPGKIGIAGIKGWVMKRGMKRAGAAAPSANRITLLRNTDDDGKAYELNHHWNGIAQGCRTLEPSVLRSFRLRCACAASTQRENTPAVR